jgi:acetyl-CoA synthetase
VVFGGFSPEALAGRIIDCKSKVVITADEGVRGGRRTPLKANVDLALTNPETSSVQKIIVCKRTGGDIAWHQHRDIWYEDLMKVASSHCAPKEMGAEEALFILYTSGSTGKPKGVLHTTGGYLVYAALTHERVFDYRPGEVYWCTADVGWVTGHSYIVYGPLANGATTLLFEGVPNYPDITRVSKIVDKHKVNILYTAPTAIRAMMAEGEAAVEGADGSSLRLLGSVGEPINPEAWNWYYKTVGKQRCPIVDTWWQTETGGVLISPLPGATALKPGSATRPFFGVVPALVDNLGNLIDGAAEGNLVILDSWPGQCARCMATTTASSTPTSRPSVACTSPVTAPAATRTATTGSPAVSMTCSTCPATAWAPPRSKAPWSPTRKWPRPRWWVCRMTSRGRASMSMSPSMPARSRASNCAWS